MTSIQQTSVPEFLWRDRTWLEIIWDWMWWRKSSILAFGRIESSACKLAKTIGEEGEWERAPGLKCPLK